METLHLVIAGAAYVALVLAVNQWAADKPEVVTKPRPDLYGAPIPAMTLKPLNGGENRLIYDSRKDPPMFAGKFNGKYYEVPAGHGVDFINNDVLVDGVPYEKWWAARDAEPPVEPSPPSN